MPAWKGRAQLRLAQAQNDEGDELQDQARSVKNQVNGDEALEGQIERQRPGQSADQHADPGHAAAIAAGEDARQQAVGGHGDGQARVAHHERVEHAHAADEAAGDDSQASSGPPSALPAMAHEPVEKPAGERPASAMAANGRM